MNKENEEVIGNEGHNMLTQFDPDSNVAISGELYDFGHYRWKMSTMGYRTLFAVAQGMERDTNFTEMHIKKDAMFEYLGLNTTNRKYEILADALREVRQSGLDICTTNKRGKRTWEGHSWISDYKVSEEDSFVHIRVNDKAMQFLIKLKQFALIQPRNYLKLTTDYQNWFYPFLKLRLGAPEGKWEISIDDIADALSLETNYVKKVVTNGDDKQTVLVPQPSKAYAKDNKDRIVNILKRVIGITPSEQYKAEVKLAKKEGREPRFRAWDYVKGADGKPTGTLYTITKETDIDVVAMAVKEGRSYSKIVFYIREKVDRMSKARLDKMHEDIVNAAEVDMGRRQGKEESIISGKPSPTLSQPAAAPSANVQTQAPAHGAVSKPLIVHHTDDELYKFGETIGVTDLEQIARLCGFTRDGDGMWYK